MTQVKPADARWREQLPGLSCATWRRLVGWLYLLAVSGWVVLVVAVAAFWQSGPIFVVGIIAGTSMGLVGNLGRYACDHCANVRLAQERAAGYSTDSDAADGVDLVASNGFVLNPADQPRTRESRPAERARRAAAREGLKQGAVPRYEPLPSVVRVDGFGPRDGVQRAASPSGSWRARDGLISLLVVAGWSVPIVVMTFALSTETEAAARGSSAAVIVLGSLSAFFFVVSILRVMTRRARAVRAAIKARTNCATTWLVHGTPSTGADLARLKLIRPARRRELGWMVLEASPQDLSLWTCGNGSLSPLVMIPWKELAGVDEVEAKFYATDARAAVLRLSAGVPITLFVCNPRWKDLFFMGERQLAEFSELLESRARP